MAVPVSGPDIFAANKIFDTSLWNVSDFALLSFSHYTSTTDIFRGAALDLMKLAFGSALSRHSIIPFM